MVRETVFVFFRINVRDQGRSEADQRAACNSEKMPGIDLICVGDQMAGRESDFQFAIDGPTKGDEVRAPRIT